MAFENETPDAFLRRLFDVAVTVADPMRVIPQILPPKPAGRVVVIGAGKASARMAEAVESVWGPCDGLVITRYGYARPCEGIEIVEAAHPVPDEAGMHATTRMLEMLTGLGADDYVLALISGGGSALLSAPAAGMSLADKQDVHRALLKSGAPIGKMNVLRKHLSRVKGGQLAAAAYPARMLALSISDVPGDKLGDIASGATVGEETSVQDALSIVDEHAIPLPARAKAALAGGSTTIPPGDRRLSTTENKIISAPSQSLSAAAGIAENNGLKFTMLGDDIEGEARDEGTRQAQLALKIQREMRPGDKPVLVLSGGECTVTGRGDGIGGPNAEFALAAAISLNGQPGIHLIACDTDGVDGAAEIAGAIVRPETLASASQKGLDPQEALARNDSHSFFAGVDGQVVTGPTLTNVNDFRAFLIYPTGE